MATTRDKRSRSWDVGAALDELVEWDALEEFMQDMPDQTAVLLPDSGKTTPADATLMGSTAYSTRILTPSQTRSAASRACSESSAAGAGASGRPGSTTAAPGTTASAWLAAGFDSGAGSSSFGSGSGVMCGSAPNAATLAQSLYAGWQQGPSSFPLQALPMERGVSWGAELLPLIDDVADSVLIASSVPDNPTSGDVGLGPFQTA